MGWRVWPLASPISIRCHKAGDDEALRTKGGVRKARAAQERDEPHVHCLGERRVSQRVARSLWT